jgi:membrane fusion protein (multidrug efflux system)
VLLIGGLSENGSQLASTLFWDPETRQFSEGAPLLRVSRHPSAVTLADGSVYPHTGKLGPVERAVDPTTGTLGVQIIFPNPDLLLRPGQYGRARILLDTRKNALLVPQRAVQELQNLYSVAVVDRDNKITFRNVKVGQREDTMWVIDQGLQPGERVVVEGLQRLQDGMQVAARNVPDAAATTGSEPAKPADGGH